MQVGGETGWLDADQVASDAVDDGLEHLVATVVVHGLVEDDTSDTVDELELRSDLSGEANKWALILKCYLKFDFWIPTIIKITVLRKVHMLIYRFLSGKSDFSKTFYYDHGFHFSTWSIWQSNEDVWDSQ